MYYVVFFTIDEEVIVAECGTLVDEEGGEWSLEQCDRMYTWDTSTEQLGYWPKASDLTYEISEGDEPQQYNTWKAAIYGFLDLLEYLGMNEHSMISDVLEDRFTDKKALVRLMGEIK